MKPIVIRHLVSSLTVGLLLVVLAFLLRPTQTTSSSETQELKALRQLNLNPQDPFQQSLFKELVRVLAPADSTRYFEWWKQLQVRAGQDILTQKQLEQQRAYRKSFAVLLGMYLKFILVFLIVMGFTYYGVQTLGLYLFIRRQQMRPPELYRLFFFFRHWLLYPEFKNLSRWLKLFFALVGRALLFSTFFAPAYVVAYSFKSDFTSQSLLFLILLGVLTNGLLITYATKFYHFLLNESRKGYVRTALVKNLSNNYQMEHRNGIRWHQLLALKKNFKGHVLQHIYMNSAFQYLSTFKEQAAFVITSLVIIEMALNIHGHLSYELLQQLLYKNFDQALYIVLGLFLIVKGTELFTDVLLFKKQQKLDQP